MFPSGSKLLFGGAVLALVAAVLYGVTQEGSLGTVGLISASVGLFLLAGVNLYTRDADVSPMDTGALTKSAAAAPVPGASLWPIVAGLGGALVVVGLVTYPVVFIFGIILLIAAAAEWMVQAWSERASSDVAFNADVRDRIAHPLEFPILAAVGVGIIIYSFSRIMLFLSKTSGPAVFAVIAVAILVVAFVVAFSPSVRAGAVATVSVVAALGLVTGGVAAALGGERELHPHETTGALADEGGCGTDAETHADEHYSQDVAATANLTARLTLTEEGTLVAKNLGVTGDQDTVVVTRANPTNVVFYNESDEERRLVLDLGVRPELDAAGEEIPDTEVPDQRCTALVEEGGSQFLTFSIPVASNVAVSDYAFVVPGVDGARVEVEVP
ncbi:MAG: hypothetical protein ABW122_09920 [Ilumatobacteraceae bacterium]